ncbi:MAG TPA: GAF domain-containing protein [Chthoniobacteraceae bacterium]|jgi:transcriptional regulator with GAF, ATPase, and Fis domain
MVGRLTVLPQERLALLRPALEMQLRETASLLEEEPFEDFFDSSMRALLVDGFQLAGADEGTVWLLDAAREFLVPRFNSGPKAESFVGSYRQSLRTGMISMVVATEQPICENDMRANRQQDKTLDLRLRLETSAMLAVPLYYVGELRGVVSCVQLQEPGDESKARGFSMEDLRRLQLTSGVMSRLIEHRLLTLCLGLEVLG